MAHLVDVQAGRLLRQFRQDKGLSQKELAAELGISFQQLQKYENATNRISAGKLSDAAAVLGKHPGDFFDVRTARALPSRRKSEVTVLRHTRS